MKKATPPIFKFSQFFNDNHARIQSFSFLFMWVQSYAFLIYLNAVVFFSQLYECSRILCSFVWVPSYTFHTYDSSRIYFSFFWIQSYFFSDAWWQSYFYLISLNVVVFFSRLFEYSRIFVLIYLNTVVFFAHLSEYCRIRFSHVLIHVCSVLICSHLFSFVLIYPHLF